MASQALKNFKAYNRLYRKKLEPEHTGEVALMRNRKVVDIYPDCEAAFAAGMERFGRNEFSFQEIGKEPVFVSTFRLSRR